VWTGRLWKCWRRKPRLTSEHRLDRAEGNETVARSRGGELPAKIARWAPAAFRRPRKRGKPEADRPKRRGFAVATAPKPSRRGNFAPWWRREPPLHPDHAPGRGRILSGGGQGREVPGSRLKTNRSSTQVALDLGVEIGDRARLSKSPSRVREECLAEFGPPERGTPVYQGAPLKRPGNLEETGYCPGDRPRSGGAHASHPHGGGPGVSELDPVQRPLSLADGWRGSMISTELQDIPVRNRNPSPGRSTRVLKENEVNLIMRMATSPSWPELLVVASQTRRSSHTPEVSRVPRGSIWPNVLFGQRGSHGAMGFRWPETFLQQELAIVTGPWMPWWWMCNARCQSLADVAKCYHTKVITTNPGRRCRELRISNSRSTMAQTWPRRSCGKH